MLGCLRNLSSGQSVDAVALARSGDAHHCVWVSVSVLAQKTGIRRDGHTENHDGVLYILHKLQVNVIVRVARIPRKRDPHPGVCMDTSLPWYRSVLKSGVVRDFSATSQLSHMRTRRLIPPDA